MVAYNLDDRWPGRPLARVTPNKIDGRSLTSLQPRLVKTVGLIRHDRYYWLLLAESHLARPLFRAMVGRAGALPLPTGREWDT